CLKIGVDIEHRIDIAQKGILRIRFIQQADERTSTVHGTVVQPIGPTTVMPDVEYQVRAVVSNARGETQFSVVRSFVDQLVICLRCAEGVPVQAIPGVLLVFRHCAWLWEAIVEKARIVMCPGNTSKPAP